MQTHNLKRRNNRKYSRQVGRGGKRGKTSGRGTKGQNARAGRKKRPEIRDIIKKIPKLRGRGKNIFKSYKKRPIVIKLSEIESVYNSGETVSPESLVSKGLIKKPAAGLLKIKLLNSGKLSKKVSVKGCLVSGGVKNLVIELGGSVS